MKPPDATPPEEDLTRFYSIDPHIVLGIPRTASAKDIEKARTRLIKKFHTDINKDPRAQQIFQNINIACDKLLGEGVGKGVSDPFSASSPREHKSTPPVEKVDPLTAERKRYYENEGFGQYGGEEKVKTLEDEVVHELKGGLLGFGYYFHQRSKEWGITEAQIAEVIRTERAQEAIKKDFMSVFWNYLSKISERGGENYIKEAQRWAELGVDISNFINLPEVVRELESRAKINMGRREFKPYVKSWMEAGWKPSAEIMDAFNK